MVQATPQPLIFFGTEDFSLQSLESLVDAGYRVAAVVTKPDSRKGRGQKLVPPAVKTFAESHGIPVWQPTKLADITPDITALQPVAGVLVSYGKIIPQSIIDLFTPGIINVHPSLLPRYRGPSPIESAIKNGDETTGVTIMQLSAEMDAGPVYDQTVHQLTGHETRPDLYETLGQTGNQLLLELLPAILNGSRTPTPQDDTVATYCQLLQKSDARLDPKQLTAPEAERHIRAHLGFPKSKLTLDGHDCIITAAHVSPTKTPPAVACRGGAYLCIDELIAPSGRTMRGADFIRGYGFHDAVV